MGGASKMQNRSFQKELQIYTTEGAPFMHKPMLYKAIPHKSHKLGIKHD